MNVGRIRRIERALKPKQEEGIAFIDLKEDSVLVNIGMNSRTMTIAEYEAALENGDLNISVAIIDDLEDHEDG